IGSFDGTAETTARAVVGLGRARASAFIRSTLGLVLQRAFARNLKSEFLSGLGVAGNFRYGVGKIGWLLVCIDATLRRLKRDRLWHHGDEVLQGIDDLRINGSLAHIR